MKNILAILLIAGLLSPQIVHARAGYLGFWGQFYPSSETDDGPATCQVCHQQVSGGNGWNEYGWSIRELLNNQANVSQSTLNTALANVESSPLALDHPSLRSALLVKTDLFMLQSKWVLLLV